ncbi:type VII secretion-associated serine protease mycosin [Mycolicibacterium fortuitum]|uniref:type VII secretion-associated serine protease mycosin n=1 Tax=Mycolicibacterium fortuitum TaxID=1766 RepID=UPI00263070B8|nr:type VII secretion-associated serine protease mycosin [Mycolicibacterium fortuitum]
MTSTRTRLLATIAAIIIPVAQAVIGAPASMAVPPPTIDPAVDIAPPDTDPGPELPMKQNSVCAASAVLADTQFNTIPASAVFQADALHQFARGDGQVVAVIDSGVNRHSRLPRLRGGGDYIMSGDGLSDCDHHGTLAAGIIAAAPSPNDGFVGVAPGAEIVSIRQTSAAFTEDRPPQGYSDADRSAANMMSLAKSIVHAANLGATVINLSVTACVDAGSPADLRALAGALYYAAVVKDVVIVAAAGNVAGKTCQKNPGYDPANPADPRNWDGVVSLSLPSYFSDLVLSVGGTTLTGDAYVHSMSGPWVGVAAPAMNIVSLDPNESTPGALINATLVKGEPVPVNGTSFAVAYVSGLAALIREKYPDLSAHQVINRIIKTAHTPAEGLNNTFGAGSVDAVAALTAEVPEGEMLAAGVPSVQLPAPNAPPPPDNTARTVALITLATAAVVLIAIFMSVFAFRKKSNP